MTSEAKGYAVFETGGYNTRLLQVMRQHELILPEEEDELRSYLHDTSF